MVEKNSDFKLWFICFLKKLWFIGSGPSVDAECGEGVVVITRGSPDPWS